MFIRIPWLITRKKILFHSISDVLIIFFLNKYLFSSFLVFAEDIKIFTLTFLPFWLLFSYIFGRYSYNELNLEKNYITIFFKLYLIALVTSLLSIIFVFIISFNINLNNYIHFDKVILIYTSFSSLILNFLELPIIWRFIKISKRKEKWLFIGSKIKFNVLSNELDFSRKQIKLIFKDLNSEFSDIKLSEIKGIFFENYNNIDFKKLLYFQNKDIKFISLEGLCENFLQRFPPDILTTEFMIRGNFNISRKSLQLRIKRIGDISFSFLLLFFTSPLIIIAGTLIYLEDRKNIFYKQERVGINENLFTIYKLRTMKFNAEEGVAKWSSKDDKRITRIGKFLRKSRLDELPQLLSVIKGEMSLIGPRPERGIFDKELNKVIPFYKTRYFIKPGLSGWAQVNYPYGASINDSKIKFSYDLYYLRNFSLLLDFLILFKTIKIVFLRRGSIASK